MWAAGSCILQEAPLYPRSEPRPTCGVGELKQADGSLSELDFCRNVRSARNTDDTQAVYRGVCACELNPHAPEQKTNASAGCTAAA